MPNADHPAVKRKPGRPPGTPSSASRRRDRVIAQAKVTPMEVMMETMTETWERAKSIDDPMERYSTQLAACAIAKDVAPYLHPRLQATTIKGDKENPLQLDLFDADALKAAVRGENPK